MSKKPQLLTYLVADLIRAEAGQTAPPVPNLLQDFKNNPEAVVTAYGLNAKAKAALFTMDRQIVGQFMLEEILSTPAPAPENLWSDPVASITSVEPNELLAAPVQVVTIMGDCILSSAVVHLASEGSFNHFVAVPVFEPMPPRLEDEKLVATFDLSGAPPGTYKVLVYNTPSSAPLLAQEEITVKEAGKA